MPFGLIGQSQAFSTGGSIVLTKPVGTASGDLVVIAFGNSSQLGNGFVESGATPAFGRSELLNYGDPGGATIDLRYRVAGGAEPATYTFTCAAFIDIAGLAVFRSNGVAVAYSASTKQFVAPPGPDRPSLTITPAVDTFTFGAWLEDPGGIATLFTADPLATVVHRFSMGTSSDLSLLTTYNVPVAGVPYVETAQLTTGSRDGVVMTTFKGIFTDTTSVRLLPSLGVGT